MRSGTIPGAGLMNNRLRIILGALVILVLSCQAPESGISPIGAIPAIPPKLLMTNSRPVSLICYVDVDQDNPLNVKDYYFSGAGAQDVPFFDYVVFGYAYLVKDAQDYVHLKCTPALQYILDNNKTFLKPLREKGIKILIEVRGGNYSASDEGIGLGLGTLDMAAIEELIPELRFPIDCYGIDGFEFNDVGGGYKAYPPYTRDLKQFLKDKPMYPDTMFQDDEGNSLSDPEINEILWREGGNNLSNLIYRTYELLREQYTVAADYGSANNDNQVVETRRPILVKDNGHGEYLVAEIRNEYMPDAYSGASASVADNLAYFVHDVPHDTSEIHPRFYNETTGENTGIYMDDKYAPFTIDLSNRLSSADAGTLAQWFTGTVSVPKQYGALYFTNLPPVSETGSESVLRTYMTIFSQQLFGRITRLYSGGGDYLKTSD